MIVVSKVPLETDGVVGFYQVLLCFHNVKTKVKENDCSHIDQSQSPTFLDQGPVRQYEPLLRTGSTSPTLKDH